MYSAVVNDGVEDFHIFTMLVILLLFVWWKVAQPVVLVLHGLYSSEEGWTVLADLAEKLQKINDEVEEKELQWLEIAEELESLEEEESAATV